ncbi:Uncharacterized protein TCM_032359 [Theobroma cacao]|uniref:Uncharacterized protein n=1 Tax=Theobroma cacao TaxID=3641 RepID=A0A061F8S4_THECC|nr:Uncharacterized protein TCM_032359 [Theobroma cacao]
MRGCGKVKRVEIRETKLSLGRLACGRICHFIKTLTLNHNGISVSKGSHSLKSSYVSLCITSRFLLHSLASNKMMK